MDTQVLNCKLIGSPIPGNLIVLLQPYSITLHFGGICRQRPANCLPQKTKRWARGCCPTSLLYLLFVRFPRMMQCSAAAVEARLYLCTIGVLLQMYLRARSPASHDLLLFLHPTEFSVPHNDLRSSLRSVPLRSGPSSFALP